MSKMRNDAAESNPNPISHLQAAANSTYSAIRIYQSRTGLPAFRMSIAVRDIYLSIYNRLVIKCESAKLRKCESEHV